MKKYIKIEDLCCANCAAKIEKAATAIEGVNSCKISFMAEKMLVEYDDSADFNGMEREPRPPCHVCLPILRRGRGKEPDASAKGH